MTCVAASKFKSKYRSIFLDTSLYLPMKHLFKGNIHQQIHGLSNQYGGFKPNMMAKHQLRWGNVNHKSSTIINQNCLCLGLESDSLKICLTLSFILWIDILKSYFCSRKVYIYIYVFIYIHTCIYIYTLSLYI